MMTTFPPGFPPPANFPPFPAAFGNHAVQTPIGWPNGSNSFAGNGEDSHQPGPMRRGGGRFGGAARQGGPYDRRQQQPRYGGNGRLTPPRNGASGVGDRGMRGGGGGLGAGGAGKWGDGAGAQTVGPREAVQGRSLKSYEDLDAVGGSVGGELNY